MPPTPRVFARASAAIVLSFGFAALAPAEQPFAWQQPYAGVLATGDLEYAPEPFEFRAGATVRYIDFAEGDDNHPGTREQPWKRHPWDPQARGRAAQSRGPATYVFKSGVAYRGVLRPGDDRGTAEEPIRLTRDPSWGDGEARIYASEVVEGWQRQAHQGIEQDRERVWMAEVDFLPRTLWMVGGDGEITRLILARWPNWQESDPNDVLREWPTWENPQWWLENSRFHRMEVDGRDRHLGIDTENLTRPAQDYVGATVWSEWGIVMGTPYPAVVEAFDEEQRAVAFRGPWTYEMSEVIARGNRYHLENMPWMLDEPGEFWVERVAEDRARIFLRLPEDRDPNTVTVEAGRHYNIIDAQQLHHVDVAGLTFRFSNVHWMYNHPAWAHPDLRAAVVRLNGSGEGITIRNCVFEHVNQPVRINVGGIEHRIGAVRIHDNAVRRTEHGAVVAAASFGREGYGPLESVELLRNDLYHIGWRALSGEHGHAVDIRFPTTSHVAGNFLYRIGGWGISVQGGKPSHSDPRPYGVPLSRHLIHHNRVEDVLLKSNDWGGIEVWQGGPFYVFNNVVFNPVAFKHWTWREGNPDNIGSFGHAYYLDAGFKTYLFNNIAAGRNNELGTRSVNTTALQNIYSFENWFFNNTFYKFAEMTRQQAPAAGRFRYLGNVIEDVTRLVFRHTDPADVAPDPNAAHFTDGGEYAYHTLAYAGNVFHDIRSRFGAFEETGAVHGEAGTFAEAVRRLDAQAADVGTVAEQPPLRDPAGRDFRPRPGGPATEQDVIAFVPWSLYAPVGEWQFTRNHANPAEIIDEHWHMTPLYRQRERYLDTPRYPLTGVNVTAERFVPGALANWTGGSALRLDGSTQYLVLPQSELQARPEPIPRRTEPTEIGNVELPDRILPEQPFEVTVRLARPLGDERLEMHVHWMREQSWGGFSELAGAAQPVPGSPDTYRFTPTVPPHQGLHRYQLLIFRSPDGSFDRQTQLVRVEAPPATFTQALRPGDARNADIGHGNFLLEVCLQTEDRQGVIIHKRAESGYVLDLVEGRPRLQLRSGSAQYTATAEAAIDDGQWHHLLIEVDRGEGAVRFYLDGRAVDARTSGRMPEGSLANEADFLVGGGPDLPHLAATFDFLRLAQGTLADARTTIEELHAWQFDGPQFRDFTGRDRRHGNAAGALLAP